MFTLKTDAIETRGQKILVQEFSAGARAAVIEATKSSTLRAQIVAAQHCAVDVKGEPLCKTFEEMARWPSDVVEAIASKAMDLSGVGAKAIGPKG